MRGMLKESGREWGEGLGSGLQHGPAAVQLVRAAAASQQQPEAPPDELPDHRCVVQIIRAQTGVTGSACQRRAEHHRDRPGHPVAGMTPE